MGTELKLLYFSLDCDLKTLGCNFIVCLFLFFWSIKLHNLTQTINKTQRTQFKLGFMDFMEPQPKHFLELEFNLDEILKP